MRLSERWIPLFAAVVGVLGGMGGAFIGGWVTNRGQDERLKNERAAARWDSRQATYANYLQAADELLLKGQIDKDPNATIRISDAEAKASIAAAVAAEAAVEIIADVRLRRVTENLTTALSSEELDRAQALRQTFIELVQQDIPPEG